MLDTPPPVPSATPFRVIIVGAGIAGPVLGLFLKRKGSDVVIYEKVAALGDVGASLCLQPNGVKVLSLLGLLPTLTLPANSSPIEHFAFASRSRTSTTTSDIITTPLPIKIASAAGGFPFFGVKRSHFQQFLIDAAEAEGIPVHWGKAVVNVTQSDSGVRVEFADGATDSAAFVVACDGLHSAVRKVLFEESKASYTGLTQTSGLCPTPSSFASLKALRNVFGPGAHFISYPISSTHTSFACTIAESTEARESWGAMSAEDVAVWKRDNDFAYWSEGVANCIATTDRVVKFGLYDRPELTTWHKGRILLIGDAAHPTSPHLGQGANQALEDCYHLAQLLPDATLAAKFATVDFEFIFNQLEMPRIERTSALVKAARTMGHSRTLVDARGIEERDEKLRRSYDDPAAALKAYEGVYSHPF